MDFLDDDDLLDDLMNIVQTDATQPQEINQENGSILTKNDSLNSSSNQENNDDEIYKDESDDGEEYEGEEEENLIDDLLEKPIDILDEKDQVNFYTYNKIQIKNMYWRGCQDTILPEGWVQVTHACGMPLFLNRQSRVCTMSRPYYIGQSSARKHDIPMSSIPCMAYKRRKETVEKQIKEHNQAKQQAAMGSNGKCPFSSNGDVNNLKIANESSPSSSNNVATTSESITASPAAQKTKDLKANKKVVVSIQTNEEKQKETILTPEQIHEYCKKLFEFDIIKVKKFKTWGDRKKFIRKSKQRKFPENAKMLKIQTKTQKGINKELNINMTNKTGLCILYEYASQVYKTNPRFEIQEKENPKDPFQAICYLNEKICGKGTGNSKKAAKNSAAEAALCVLIPDFKGQTSDNQKNNDEMYSFFDGYNVEHTHVYALSQKLGAPMPYDILLTCLKYNFAINMSRNRKQFIEEEIKPIKYRNCLYKMKLAQYDVEVNCTKKKEGRQLAAQKILKLMHPHIDTWGSMLRLYGSRMAESFLKMENKNDDENGTKDIGFSNKKATTTDSDTKNADSLMSNQGSNSVINGTIDKNVNQKAKPNKELLEKLKEEMRKLRKVNASETDGPNSTFGCDLGQDTLLTIQPLLLGNNEFQLSSSNYLMSSNDNKEPLGDEKTEIDDGKIMFTDALLNDKQANENNNHKVKSKKRKIGYSDDENDRESSETEEGEDDDDDDDDDDNEDDDDENSRSDDGNQSQSD